MPKPLSVRDYNRDAWDKAVERGSQWTVPVDPAVIAAARRGDWFVILTPEKPVPRTSSTTRPRISSSG